jgi:hypothetical protein
LVVVLVVQVAFGHPPLRTTVVELCRVTAAVAWAVRARRKTVMNRQTTKLAETKRFADIEQLENRGPRQRRKRRCGPTARPAEH